MGWLSFIDRVANRRTTIKVAVSLRGSVSESIFSWCVLLNPNEEEDYMDARVWHALSVEYVLSVLELRLD